MKYQGKGTLVVLGVLLVGIIVLGLAAFRWYLAGYNKAVRLDEEAKTAWANVDSAFSGEWT